MTIGEPEGGTVKQSLGRDRLQPQRQSLKVQVFLPASLIREPNQAVSAALESQNTWREWCPGKKEERKRPIEG